jgi:hypothetical protein
MRVVFCHSDKPREHLLADAFAEGVRAHGDTCEMRALTPEPQTVLAEVACMVGVKSRELYRAYHDQGTHIVYLDKGYARHARPGPVKVWEYWRASLDAHHPTQFLGKPDMPADRSDDLGLVLKPWRKSGDRIVVAGSSQKYHDFYGLRHPTQWAQKLVKQIRAAMPAAQIVYRPKPSWKEAVPIEGTKFSRSGDIFDVLEGAWCLVTHGSNAVFEAVCEGVPCVVLGDAVAKPISSTSVEDVANPRLASYQERHQWLANLAYWQWTLPEFASGAAWGFIRPKIYGAAK